MKFTTLLFLFCIACLPGLAQDAWPTSTSPSYQDSTNTALGKIGRTLDESRNNYFPLWVKGTVSTTPASPVVRTASIATATTSGTVAAGARTLTFIFSANFTGTLLSGTFSGATAASVTINAGGQADTLAAVGYVVTTGTLQILEVQ
jgi:hypothetical protein